MLESRRFLPFIRHLFNDISLLGRKNTFPGNRNHTWREEHCTSIVLKIQTTTGRMKRCSMMQEQNKARGCPRRTMMG